MATYSELFGIASATPDSLAQRIRVAISVKAHAIAADAMSTENAKAWAVQALRNPSRDFQAVLNYLLSANKALTVAQITGANDEAVQTAVDNAVDQLLGV